MTEPLKQRINDAMKDAMRAKDKRLLGAIRLITAAIKQIEVDKRIDVDDNDVLAILDKMVKQRRDSIQQYNDAGRDELAEQEQFEIDVIAEYMPAPLDEAAIAAMIDEAISSTGATDMKGMGQVMGILKPKLQGRADMGAVSGEIKKRLS